MGEHGEYWRDVRDHQRRQRDAAIYKRMRRFHEDVKKCEQRGFLLKKLKGDNHYVLSDGKGRVFDWWPNNDTWHERSKPYGPMGAEQGFDALLAALSQEAK